MKYLLAIVVLVFAAGEVRAQLGVPEEAPDALHVLTGKVFLERSGMLSERLEVWLTPETGAGKIDTFSESSGNFQFEGLRAGTYTIRVRAPLGSPYGDGEERIAIYVSKTTTRYNVIVTMRYARMSARPSRHLLLPERSLFPGLGSRPYRQVR